MKNIKYLAVFLWILTIGVVVYDYFIQVLFPKEIVNILTQNPVSIYFWVSRIISLILFSIFTFRLLLNKFSYQTTILLCALAFRLISILLLEVRLEYMGVGFLEDTISFLIGIILVSMQNKDTKLFTITSMRMIVFFGFLAFIGVVIATHLTHSTIPNVFSNFVSDKHYPMKLDFLPLIEFVAMIGILFRNLISKYLFLASSLLTLLGEILLPDALTGIDSFFCQIFMLFQGMLFMLICTNPLRTKFKINYERLNIFRTLVFSNFSNKFYQEVYTKWKGAGLSYYFIFILFLGVLQLIDLNYQNNHLSFLNEKKYTSAIAQLPDIYVQNGELRTNSSKRIYLFDAEKNPFIYIDNSKKTMQPPSSVKILINRENLIIKARGHITNYFHNVPQFAQEIALIFLKYQKITPVNFVAFVKALNKQSQWFIFPIYLVDYLRMVFIIFIIALIRNSYKKSKGLNLGIKSYMRILITCYMPYAFLVFILNDIFNLNPIIVMVSILILWGIRKKLGITASVHLHNFEMLKSPHPLLNEKMTTLHT